MDVNWVYSDQNVNWEELSILYKVAPLGDKPANDLKVVFESSKYKCFAYSSGKIMGAGRALSDGLDCSYLCDVAVHPEAQSMGLGRSIVEKLVSFSEGHKKIILYSSPGKEIFYEKIGFGRMTTAMGIFSNQEQAIEWGLIESKP